MKALPLVLLVFLTSCSSTSGNKSESDVSKITNSSFKKERPLSTADVPDYYPTNTKSMSPALQDETLDRHSKSEVSGLEDSKDPLLAIAVMCSQGDYNDAFALASKAYNKYQKIASYWNQVANCHLKQGSYRKALLFYNKSLEVTPNYVPALNNIGVLYSRQGQDQKALVAFERANKKSKFSKTPRYNLAKTYLTYGLADEALPIFVSLLESSPNDVDLTNAVASAHFVLGNYQEARSYFQKIPTNNFESAEVGLNYVLTLKKLGKRDEAKKVFAQIEEPKGQALREYYSMVQDQLGEK